MKSTRLAQINQGARWIAMAGLLWLVSKEMNKLEIPIPTLKGNGRAADIVPKQQRLRKEEIDFGTQSGFNLAMEEIKEGDEKHVPKMHIGEMGQVSYSYYRKEGDAPKTEGQLQTLINQRTERQEMRNKIASVLAILSERNVSVVVGQPDLKGAAGEWNPSTQTIRIAPGTLAQGSDTVLRVLNHEAIHVAQSCQNGGINYKPKPLSIELSPKKIFDRQLSSDIYKQIGEQTRRLESEAYSYEYSSKAARHFLIQHCRAS